MTLAEALGAQGFATAGFHDGGYLRADFGSTRDSICTRIIEARESSRSFPERSSGCVKPNRHDRSNFSSILTTPTHHTPR